MNEEFFLEILNKKRNDKESFKMFLDETIRIIKNKENVTVHVEQYPFSDILDEGGNPLADEKAIGKSIDFGYFLIFAANKYGVEFVFEKLLSDSVDCKKYSKFNPINWFLWIFNKIAWSEIKVRSALDENFSRAIKKFQNLPLGSTIKSSEEEHHKLFKAFETFEAKDLTVIIQKIAEQYKQPLNTVSVSERVDERPGAPTTDNQAAPAPSLAETPAEKGPPSPPAMPGTNGVPPLPSPAETPAKQGPPPPPPPPPPMSGMQPLVGAAAEKATAEKATAEKATAEKATAEKAAAEKAAADRKAMVAALNVDDTQERLTRMKAVREKRIAKEKRIAEEKRMAEEERMASKDKPESKSAQSDAAKSLADIMTKAMGTRFVAIHGDGDTSSDSDVNSVSGFSSDDESENATNELSPRAGKVTASSSVQGDPVPQPQDKSNIGLQTKADKPAIPAKPDLGKKSADTDASSKFGIRSGTVANRASFLAGKLQIRPPEGTGVPQPSQSVATATRAC